MLKEAEADTPERKYRVDPLRDGVGAYSYRNAVNGVEALLSMSPPDADKSHGAAAVGAARSDGP